jgi:hypothetical protein
MLSVLSLVLGVVGLLLTIHMNVHGELNRLKFPSTHIGQVYASRSAPPQDAGIPLNP